MIPTLETRRTRLRAPVMADFAPYAEHLAFDHARDEDGPYTEKQAWNDVAAGVGQWHLKGYDHEEQGAMSVWRHPSPEDLQ